MDDMLLVVVQLVVRFTLRLVALTSVGWLSLEKVDCKSCETGLNEARQFPDLSFKVGS